MTREERQKQVNQIRQGIEDNIDDLASHFEGGIYGEDADGNWIVGYGVSGSTDIVITPERVEFGDAASEPFSPEAKAAPRWRSFGPRCRKRRRLFRHGRADPPCRSLDRDDDLVVVLRNDMNTNKERTMRKILLTMFVCTLASFVCVAAQCMATTKKGTQCKRQASPDSQYCWQHGGKTKSQRDAVTNTVDAIKGCCKATTKAGTQCKRQAKPGSEFCWQHGGATEDVAKPATETATASTPEKQSVETDASAKSESTQCTATTKSGKRCARKAQPGSAKCWQHQ